MNQTVSDKLSGRKAILSVSGGKDSAATSLYLRELGIEHVRVFADTGWEHELTYEYLRGPLTEALGVIHEVRGERTMDELVTHKGAFPSRVMRFCTTELKIKPLAAFVKSFGDDVVNVVGIRAAESAARAKMLERVLSRLVSCVFAQPN
jgi:3'-phosphoadenosine 5'-phosphosulfate sulfotransferase (PAPS reductase)/FAD synthetase